MEDTKYRVWYLMESTDLLSFNNRRVLHARESFDVQSGPRHLQGTYVDLDEFASRLRYLSERVDHNTDSIKAINRIGNMSH